MRYLLASALLVLTACGGGDTTAPDPMAGTWNATTMNGAPLPATYTAGSIQIRVVSRRLTLIGDGGMWNDSTVMTVSGLAWNNFQPVVYNSSRGDFIKWWRNGNAITVVGSGASSQLALFFILQADGSLLSDFNDGMAVVYRR